ncbi:MAG: class I SAM-dependent methyltransferase [Kiritimatiellae bacterium]|nr:class I SAM-dependent methyltransferase [Kiritimatiellia bacterium]
MQSADRFFGRDKVYDYGECPACGALFLFPDAEWSPEKVYPAEYDCYTKDTRITWVHRLLPSYFFPTIPRNASGPVLDMGCGTGDLVEYLSSRYPDVVGVEMSDEATQLGQRLGRRVVQGTWESYEVESGTLGTLIMNHVIEHLADHPAKVFDKGNRMLRRGGLWIVRTPNAASWGRRHYGPCWHPLETPRHVLIYTPEGLGRLAEAHGFRVGSRRCCGRPYDLLQSNRYRRRAGAPQGWDRIFDLPMGPLVARLAALWLNLTGKGDAFEVCLVKE